MSSPPSLDVVEDAVRRESGAQERRADSADTRAGFVLAFSALVVTLGAGDVWVPLGLASHVFAAAAALVALRAMAARDHTATDLDFLRDYLARDPVSTREALLDRAMTHHHASQRLVLAKEARLRLASGLVTGAVAFALAGATVEVVR